MSTNSSEPGTTVKTSSKSTTVKNDSSSSSSSTDRNNNNGDSMNYLTYEQKLSIVKGNPKSEPLKDVLFFPKDNVRIVHQKRDIPKGLELTPRDITDAGEDDVHMQEIFRYFTSDIVKLEHPYNRFKKVATEEGSKTFGTQKFEIDAESKKKKDDNMNAMAKVDVNLDGIKSASSTTQKYINKKMTDRLFKIYDMSSSSTEFDWQGGAEATVCKRIVPKTFGKEKKFDLSVRDPILIEVANFEPRLFQKHGQVEPLFLEMALFDLKNKKKISETFHVDLNSQEVLTLLPNSSTASEPSKLRSAVFHCFERTKDVFLYIKVLKLLQGDEDDSADPYLKGDKAKDNDVKKLKKAAVESASRLHEFRQPIGWTAVAMFDDNEEIVLPTSSITQFFRTKGNMSDSSFMNIFGSDTTSQMKKIKPLPMSLQLKFTELPDYVPEHRPFNVVLVNNQEDPDGPSTLARDMKEFPVNPIMEFNGHEENWMFIYPEQINFSKGLSSRSARNITVQVQIKDNDSYLDDVGLPLICGRSNEPNLRTSIYTKVSYHNRTPYFNDEIKIKLPTKITSAHHILFTFYHVRCQAKANKPVQTVLGHSIVPLLQDVKSGRIMHGRKGCSVIAEFTNKEGYSTSDVRRSSKYVDYGKQLFEVVFEPLSTIHTSDPKLAAFYRTLPIFMKNKNLPASQPMDSSSVQKDIAGLQDVPATLTVQHLPIILNQLLRTVCCETYEQSQRVAFSTLLKVLDNVSMGSRDKHGETGRNELLQEYITQAFQLLPDVETPLHYHLLEQWFNLLQEYSQKRKSMKASNAQYHHQQEGQETRLPLIYSWWLFDLTYKSIMLEVSSRKLLNNSDRLNPERFNQKFYEKLQALIELMGEEILYRSGVGLNLAKVLNSNLALFLRDLLNVMDRGFVMFLMDSFLKIVTSDRKNFEVLQELKITFLTVITDYEHYIPMSLPMDYTIDRLLEADRLAKDHFLAGILMSHIKDDIINPERTVRMRALTLMRNLLTKHEYDERYQSSLSREKISGIYFPFAVYFLDVFDEYRSIAEEKVDKLKKTDQDAQNEVDEIESRLKQTQLDEVPQATEAPAPSSPSTQSSGEGEDAMDFAKTEETMETKKLNEELEQARKRATEAKKQFVEESKRVKAEQQSILVCILFIVKHMNRSLLKQWWSKEMQHAKRLQSFLLLFILCLDVFEYEGKSAITERAKYGIETSTTASLSEAKVALENMYTSLNRRTSNFRSAASSLKTGRTAGKGTLTRNFRVTRQTFKKSDSTGDASGIVSGESKQIIKQMILWDGNISSETSLSILDILLDMIIHLEKEFFASALSPLKSSARGFELLFKLLTKFMETNQSEKTMDSMLSVMKHFIILYRPIIFSRGTPFSETLCRQLLVKCHSRFEKIRSQATAILYTLIKNNYLHMGNFTRTKIQTTVALSNLVADLDDKSIVLLRASFIAMAEYASSDTVERKNPLPDGSGRYSRTNSLRGSLKSPFDRLSRDENKDFPTQVQNLVTRLEKALLDTKKVKDMEKTSHDHEMMSDLYWEIAKQYRHAPELSVTWVNNLADFHKKHDRWIEAAQCIAFIISEVLEYLKLSGLVNETLSSHHLHKLSPLLRSENFEELHALFEESGAREQPVFESHYFTEDGFLQLISQCIQYCNNDSLFEYSIELYKMRIEYFEQKEDYAALEEQHKLLAQSYGSISKANVRQARLFGSYYKVSFYGSMHSEEIRNKQFIYKMPRITRLAEIVEYMETVFYNKYGKGNVKFVSDSFEATEAIKKENCAYIQITSVKPHVSDPLKRRTQFAQYMDIDEFMFETPFTKSGKSHGELVDQYKRKTVVKTSGIFPNVKVRFEIVSHKDTDLSPIENAIEIIEGSLLRLELELKRDPPSINNLQMVLSGTVIPQVNEGIPAIVKSFLGCEKPETKFDSKYLQMLRDRLHTFLSLNSQGIELGNKYASLGQQPLQRQFEKGYTMLEDLFKPYLA